jgi:NAD(P)-dependent dehydrogenase (short-subunit alcohol dehydrogenase family)
VSDSGDLFSLRGKRALVSGGSRGIGLEIARGFAAAGVEVTISSRKADAVAAAAEELGCRGVPADLSTRDGCEALAAEIDGPLHILVNNAGASWGAPIDEFPESGWDKVIDTNVKGVFELTRALLPRLREAASPEDPARVLNIGSVDGIRVPAMESYPYSTSKAAVHMLTRHLAKRLASEAITVNAIAPGPFPSKMTAFMLDEPEAREAVEAAVPLGRIGNASDLVGTSTFLCSRAGSYLTGAIVPIDGGITGCG